MASGKAAQLINLAATWVQLTGTPAAGNFWTASINLANGGNTDTIAKIAISTATVAGSVAAVDLYTPGKVLLGNAGEFERTAVLIFPGEYVWVQANLSGNVSARASWVEGSI